MPTIPLTTPAPPSAHRKEMSAHGDENETAGNLLAKLTHPTSTDCHIYYV